jgi:hypothetical protein
MVAGSLLFALVYHWNIGGKKGMLNFCCESEWALCNVVLRQSGLFTYLFFWKMASNPTVVVGLSAAINAVRKDRGPWIISNLIAVTRVH